MLTEGRILLELEHLRLVDAEHYVVMQSTGTSVDTNITSTEDWIYLDKTSKGLKVRGTLHSHAYVLRFLMGTLVKDQKIHLPKD